MVNLHFLSLLEALLECRAVTLCKLIPMWKEVLFTDKNIKVYLNQNVSKLLLFIIHVLCTYDILDNFTICFI